MPVSGSGPLKRPSNPTCALSRSVLARGPRQAPSSETADPLAEMAPGQGLGMEGTRIWLVLATVLLQTTGCDRGTDPEFVVVGDSAGVQIVESLRPMWPEGVPWTIGHPPLLDLAETGSGPYHEFHRVVGATRLSSGLIVVANQGSREVRVFTAGGEFRRAAGSAGEGPGEFGQLTSVHELSDGSLGIFDARLARITYLSAELELVGTRAVQEQGIRITQLHWDDADTPIAVGYAIDDLASAAGLYRLTETVLTLVGGVDEVGSGGV